MKATARIFKHYVLTVIGIIYFILYFFYKNDILLIIQDIEYGAAVFSYASALIAVFTSYSTLSIILRSTRSFIIGLGEKKGSKVYPILSGGVLKFMAYANYIISVYIGFSLLVIPKEHNHIVNKVVSTIFIVIALLVISNLIILIFEKRGVFRFRFANNLSLHLSSIIKKILLVFLWIIGGITIISNLGYDVSALIAGAGIGGLALALGAQKSLTNVFGAITIVLNKPFRIGDFVKIDNTIGTVRDIGISYLTIIDRAGHQVMIPNEVIMTSFVENYSVRENRRTDIVIGLEYSTSQDSLELSVKIIEDILSKYVSTHDIERYRVNFDRFGEYSLDVNITYFSLIPDYQPYLKQKEKINLEIKKSFEEHDIGIAFPTRSLIIHDEKEEKK